MAREMLHRLESRDIQGRTKIRTAAESRLDTFDLHILIGLGVNIEARCNMEWTPLMAAVRVGTPKGVEALLNAGANIKASDLSKRTVLVAAIRSHSSENIELLLKHTTDPDERVAAFCEAATGGQAELTRMIYQPGMSISPSLLPYATSRGFHQIVFPLLEWRADVNGKDYQGRTALEWAIRNRDATLQKALVAAGADTRGKSLEEFAHWVRVRSLDQL
jgi:ankyrin repeat protein